MEGDKLLLQQDYKKQIDDKHLFIIPKPENSRYEMIDAIYRIVNGKLYRGNYMSVKDYS
jgi:hypothetical protein